MSNVGTFARNVYCCVEHAEKFKKFKCLKENFKKIVSGEIVIGSINKKSNSEIILGQSETENMLNEINSLIKYDINMKKLFTSINIEKFDIIFFLLTILGQFDIQIDNLVLLNISNFMREIDTCKKYSNSEFYQNIFSYFISLDFNLYKKITINNTSYNDKIKSEVSNFNIILNIFNFLFSNFSNIQILDLEITYKLLEKIFNIILSIIDSKDIKLKISDNNKNSGMIPISSTETENYYSNLKFYENIILNSSIYYLNILYFSKHTDVDMVFLINDFIITNDHIFQFILIRTLHTDIELVKNLIIFLKDFLNNIYNIKIEYLPFENTKIFMSKYREFLKELLQIEIYNSELKNYIFMEKTIEILKILDEKFYLSQSSQLGNISLALLKN